MIDPESRSEDNPFEIGLPIAGGVAFVGGLIASAAGTGAQDPSGLAWATFGNQLSTIGVVILIGVAFYSMVRWNKTHDQ